MHLKKTEKLKQMNKLLEPETRPTTTFTLNQPTCNILPTILCIILSGMNIHTPLDGITTEGEREEGGHPTTGTVVGPGNRCVGDRPNR